MIVAFIGQGKMGRTLARAFESVGCSIVAASSRKLDEAQAALDRADIAFITVSDDAIRTVAAALQWRPGVAAVHCSGALGLDALSSAQAAGAQTACFHPLQMFADIETTLQKLPGATISLEGDEDLVAELERIVIRIGATPLRLHAADRRLYHASANYAGPFVIALLREASRLWQISGLTEEQALKALIPLIKGTLASVEAVGLAGGMGGAMARGDIQTIAGHLQTLKQNAPDQGELYRQLALKTIPLAIQRGSLAAADAERIRHLLDEGINILDWQI